MQPTFFSFWRGNIPPCPPWLRLTFWFSCRYAQCAGQDKYHTWPGSTNETRSYNARGLAGWWRCSPAHNTSADSRLHRATSHCIVDRWHRDGRALRPRHRTPESSRRIRGLRETPDVETSRPVPAIVGHALANHCLQNNKSTLFSLNYKRRRIHVLKCEGGGVERA